MISAQAALNAAPSAVGTLLRRGTNWIVQCGTMSDGIKHGKAVANYPGAKARLAPWIIDHLPDHNTYVEVFGGTAGVLVHKPESINEVYNDGDDDLVNFFRVLRDRSEELLAWLRRTPYSRSVFEDTLDDYHDDDLGDDPVVRAGRFWFLLQASFNGKLPSRSGFSTSTSARGYPSDSQARNYHRSRERLEKFADRFAAVTVECLDWRDIVERYDSATTAFYVDPPYYGVSSQNYYIEGDIDHAALIDTLADIEGEAVISYGELPDHPDEWTVLERTKDSTLSRGVSEERECDERLLLTFDPDHTPIFQSGPQRTLCDVDTETDREGSQ